MPTLRLHNRSCHSSPPVPPELYLLFTDYIGDIEYAKNTVRGRSLQNLPGVQNGGRYSRLAHIMYASVQVHGRVHAHSD